MNFATEWSFAAEQVMQPAGQLVAWNVPHTGSVVFTDCFIVYSLCVAIICLQYSCLYFKFHSFTNRICWLNISSVHVVAIS